MLAENAELTKASAGKVLNSLVDIITLSLRSGKSVSLLGFGTFAVKPRAARVGRNPKTGEPIQIDAANVPVFKAGKALKDAVNSGSVVAEEA
ncbi:MAG: HU family DNA-binding protein [Gammaproteobacteria bacterium]